MKIGRKLDKRKYIKSRRAERQTKTRERIVDAVVALCNEMNKFEAYLSIIDKETWSRVVISCCNGEGSLQTRLFDG